MSIYVHHHIKNFIPPGTYSDECYGPFKTMKGAKTAKDLLIRIDVNTGEYWNAVKIIRRKNAPEFRTLTWPEWCSSDKYTRAEYLKLHE